MRDNDWRVMFGIYGAVGVQLVGAIAVGLWFGMWLDRKWGTAPWIGFSGIVVGAVGGFWNLIRVLKWNERRRGE